MSPNMHYQSVPLILTYLIDWFVSVNMDHQSILIYKHALTAIQRKDRLSNIPSIKSSKIANIITRIGIILQTGWYLFLQVCELPINMMGPISVKTLSLLLVLILLTLQNVVFAKVRRAPIITPICNVPFNLPPESMPSCPGTRNAATSTSYFSTIQVPNGCGVFEVSASRVCGYGLGPGVCPSGPPATTLQIGPCGPEPPVPGITCYQSYVMSGNRCVQAFTVKDSVHLGTINFPQSCPPWLW
jgi:hypothetical protein